MPDGSIERVAHGTVDDLREFIDSSERSAHAGERLNWLRVVELATSKATEHRQMTRQERLAWVREALRSLDLARLFDALTSAEVLIRKSHLYSYLIAQFGTSSEEPMLNADSMVPALLDDLPPQEDVERMIITSESRSRVPSTEIDKESLLRLRRVKSALRALLPLAEHVTDEGVKRQLVGWRELSRRLP
jgi:hypothetical protein